MTKRRCYLVDSDVLIQAKNHYYSFSICPGFWRTLLVEHSSDNVISVDRVREELLRENDNLSEWVAKKVPKTFFKKTDSEEVVAEFQNTQEWAAANPQFRSIARSDFASAADGWLVAYAKVNGCVVVTNEVRAPESQKKIKLPDVCDAFKVDCLNPFGMLKALQSRFVRFRKKD